ncbi:MAG TPA: FecR family protein [Chitinophagaceae bacterium]|nr:FecR family protein [Chitinophagaceae bacterium]
MDKNTFTELLDKYIQGTASTAEKFLLEEYYEQLSKPNVAYSQNPEQDAHDEALRKQILDNILFSIKQPAVHSITHKNKKLFFIKVAAAAAVVIFIISGIFFSFSRKQQHIEKVPEVVLKKYDKPILPGGNKALLTLASGLAIVLDSVGNGTIAHQGNSTITKSGGHLLYGSDKNAVAETEYNILTTPKGGQYHLTLADGTEVWLNSSSSIRFPVAFTGSERNIEMTGEAYFEVTKNAYKPFHVKVNDMTLEVLGTHFNIMAYNDEPTINTTLLEGAVKVSDDTRSSLLKPSQQSKFNKLSKDISVVNTDTTKAVAWKNGMFMFSRDDIKTIMRQVGRWYDVDINYSGRIDSRLYSGSISKYVNAPEVLKILQLGGIKFKIEGNKITIL